MQLSVRNLVVILVVVAGASWWLLRDNSEAEVRGAHQELIRILNKSGEGDEDISVLSARSLQGLFANSSEVSGDVEGLAGTYSPEQLLGLVVRVRSVFEVIDVSITEPVISFPGPDDATAEFSAVLSGQGKLAGFEALSEARTVTTRMRRTDGDWQFYEFVLVESE